MKKQTYRWHGGEQFSLSQVPELDQLRQVAEAWFSRIDVPEFEGYAFRGINYDPVPVDIVMETDNYQVTLHKEMNEIWVKRVEEILVMAEGGIEYMPYLPGENFTVTSKIKEVGHDKE